MKYSLVLVALLGALSSLTANTEAMQTETAGQEAQTVSPTNSTINVSCPSCSDAKDETMVKEQTPAIHNVMPKEDVLEKNNNLLISVVGQGVAPMNTASPAQAYALAKRAAVADAYRLIAEKVKGVRIDGQDLIKNMMVKRSTVRTSVQAMVRNANIVETTFKEGLCEVEMEIVISHAQFQ